jgi:hypothetical protein
MVHFDTGSKKAPIRWYEIGLNFILLCCCSAFFFWIEGGFGVFTVLAIAASLFYFVGFIAASLRQRAQFSIKHLLAFTFAVAVLGSIYRCLGLGAAAFALVGFCYFAAMYLSAGREIDIDIAHRHSWNQQPPDPESGNGEENDNSQSK